MEDISLHILDIAENSIAAGATEVTIRIIEEPAKDLFTVTIRDNGRGMSEEFRKKVLDPFSTSRTTRKVGLGLSLLAQSARETGGDVAVHSRENTGTTVSASFRPSHIDMKPVGNITDTLLVLIAGNPEVDFLFIYEKDGRNFTFDTREIKLDLDGVPINSAPVISALREMAGKALSAIKNETV